MSDTPDVSQRRLIVTPMESGRRLDVILAERFPEHSRSSLQRLIREGHVRIAGSAASPSPSSSIKAGRALLEGDVIEIEFPRPEASPLVPEPMPLVILHEDRDLLVLDKPPGLVVHPGAGVGTGTLVHALLHHCDDLSGIGGVQRPGIVHRLDKETSGVMVVAKNDAAHRDLTRQFQDRAVTKVYLALVCGRVKRTAGSIDVPIGRDTRQRVKISARTGRPREAFTAYRALERFEAFTWLEARPRTGRTHQIRVHLKLLGHPIVGDRTYGGLARAKQLADVRLRQALERFGRLALHAHRISFTHPATGRLLTFEAKAPESFERLLEALRAL